MERDGNEQILSFLEMKGRLVIFWGLHNMYQNLFAAYHIIPSKYVSNGDRRQAAVEL